MMVRPTAAPSPSNIEEWHQYALAYLRSQLNDAAPVVLEAPYLQPNSPLDGEGGVAIFQFLAKRSAPAEEQFYVVVGLTEPNYYPSYGLGPDDVFSLHLGTRFMLVLGVAQAAESLLQAYDPVADSRAIADRVAPRAELAEVRTAAAFDVEGQLHTVLSANLGGRDVYIMGADAPHGFSTRTDLPPQVVYRLHIGWVLRNEPDPEHRRTGLTSN